MENRKYLENIKEELEAIYNGSTEELNVDNESKSFYDYICNDVLDYEYTMTSVGTYKGCKLYITLGGPNVWIDTTNNTINLAWGTDRDSIWLPDELAEELDNIMCELLQVEC